MALNPDRLRQIRPMSEADLDAVVAIEAATFPDPWPRHALAHEALENSFCSAFVAEVDGATAGYAFCWVIYEQAHLINIAVDEALRGQGFGEALLVHALRHARAQGADVIHLEVRESNRAAIALYQKHGFAILGRKDKYYNDGSPAVLMEANLRGC
jgi:[ribosomal protein S18]-alanine N-acetyltransferase